MSRSHPAEEPLYRPDEKHDFPLPTDRHTFDAQHPLRVAMEEIIIHGGYPKTGTSALQLFLRKNRQRLKQRGVYYPEGNKTGKTSALSRQSLSSTIPRRLRAYGTGLISNEGFVARPHPHGFMRADGSIDSAAYWLAKQHALTQLRSKFAAVPRVRILIYLRPQIDFVRSLYNEAVKRSGGGLHFFAEGLPQFVRLIAPLLDYQKQITTIEEVFGAENVIVGFYARDQLVDGDIRRDFLGRIPIESAGLIFDEPQVNQSLCAPVMAYVLEANRVPPEGPWAWAQRMALAKACSRVSMQIEEEFGPQPVQTDAAELRSIQQLCSKGNQELAAKTGIPLALLQGNPEPGPGAGQSPSPQWVQKRIEAALRQPQLRSQSLAAGLRLALSPRGFGDKQHARLNPHAR